MSPTDNGDNGAKVQILFYIGTFAGLFLLVWGKKSAKSTQVPAK